MEKNSSHIELCFKSSNFDGRSNARSPFEIPVL